MEATLCLILKGDKILLGYKKRGFGEGKWNGFGSKIEENESPEEAVIREVKEEVNLEIKELEKVGELEFYLDEKYIHVHVYKSEKWEGEIKESEEMYPRWFRIREIPYEKMWEDDIHWLPLVLKGYKIKGTFYFKEGKLEKYILKNGSEN